MIRILFFGLTRQSGTTVTAIHAARYFANGGYSVALIEPANTKSPILKTYIEGDEIPYTKEGVSLYPTWNGEEPADADVIIVDMGMISPGVFVQTDNFDRSYLCADNNEESVEKLEDFFSYADVKAKDVTVLLKECSQAYLQTIKRIYSKTYIVENDKTSCPQTLEELLNMLCCMKGMTPPEIHYDLSDWNEIVAEEPKKKKLFGNKKEKPVEIAGNPVQIPVGEEQPDLIEYDEEGLPIPVWTDINDDPLVSHQRDPMLANKPAREIKTEDGEKPEQLEIGNVATDNKASVKDIAVNTAGQLKEAGETVAKGLGTVGRKLADKIRDAKAKSDAVKEQREKERAEAALKEKEKKILTNGHNKDMSESDTDQTSEAESHISEVEIPTIETEKESDKKTERSGFKALVGKLFTDTDKPVNEQATDPKIAALVLAEENKAVAQTESKKEEEKTSKLSFAGHITIFITGLKHGVGCSHTASSIAASVAGKNNSVCMVHPNDTEFIKDPNVTELTNIDFPAAYKMGKTIIFDRGCLGELSREERAELLRADVKVLVCGSGENDIKALARFIYKCGDTAKDWVYVFDMVSGKKKIDHIKELMQEYTIVFLPMHDYDEIPHAVSDMWNKTIKKKVKF